MVQVIFQKDAYWKTVPRTGTTSSGDPCLQPTSIKSGTTCAQLHIWPCRPICGSNPARVCSLTQVSTTSKEETLSNVGMAAAHEFSEKGTPLSPITFRHTSIGFTPMQEVLNNVPLGKSSGDKWGVACQEWPICPLMGVTTSTICFGEP